jgi:hypothetical protein
MIPHIFSFWISQYTCYIFGEKGGWCDDVADDIHKFINCETPNNITDFVFGPQNEDEPDKVQELKNAINNH